MNLGQPADVRAREAPKQVIGHRHAEDAVPEEGKPAVGVHPVIDPGGVRDCPASKIVGQRLDQRREAFGAPERVPLAPPAAPANPERHV